MKLKSITIKGFKSFYKKTKIDILDGLITIIGPNGSGKSNILDAIRWVLGEQSIKNLRGDKMEDVIFAGTDKYGKLNSCDVEIILDNCNNEINLPFTEISIKRKLYRDGNNIYYINNKIVRLKDIKELFFDSGIGKEGYSLISQGKIDEIINSSSFNKRKIFEEASGISKYRYDKEESEKKIENASKNLERLNDIYQEISNQLKPLESQRNKAIEYLNLKKDLMILDIDYNSFKYSQMKEKEFALQTEKKELEKNIILFEQNLNNIILDIDEKKNKIKTLEDNIQSLISKENYLKININNIKNNIEKQDTIKLMKQDYINNIIKEKNSIIENIKKLREKEFFLLESIENKNKDLTFLQKINSELAEKIDFECLNNRAKELDIENIESSLKEYNNIIIENNIQKKLLLEKVSQSEINKKDIDEKITKEKNIFEKMCLDKKKKEIELKKYKEDISLKEEELILKQNELNKLNLIYNDQNEKYNKLANEKKEFSVKLETYRKLESDMDGLYSSVKRILKNTNLKGILNIISNVISVEEKYEKAIEIALGNSSQNIITIDTSSAQKAIDFLKANSYGRATFLPLDSIKSNKLILDDLQICSDVVYFDEKYRNVIEFLLGKTIIAKDFIEGKKIAKKYNNKYRIVTLEGELFSPGGSITGGHYYNSNGTLSRKRIITELDKKIHLIDKDLNEFYTEIDINKKNIQKIQSELDSISEENNALYRILSDIQSDINKFNIDIGIKENHIENFLKEYEILVLNINKYNEELYTINNNEFNYKAIISNLNTEIQNLNDSKNSNNANLNSLKEKLQLNIINKQNIENLLENEKNELILVKDNIFIETEKLNTKEEDIRLLYLEIQNIENQILNNIEENNILQVEIEETELEVSDKKNEYIYLKNLVDNLFVKKEELDKNKFNNAEKQIILNNKIDNIFIQINEVINYLKEEYNIDNILISNERELKNTNLSEINGIKLKIKNLGNVNIDSIEEYDKLYERYSVYKEQILDIENSIRELEIIIKNFEENMKKDFAFSIKNINETFGIVFKKIFGGGEGKIILENNDDILNTNIDIYAQPPGKKLKSLSMMSGGEKALVAISLLFAIQINKPTPFCILDEIDAPLDDSNVHKYSKFLKEMSKEIQFIAITHRRGTIEASDYIYGVSMQEKGVSNVVSMKFDQALDYIEN